MGVDVGIKRGERHGREEQQYTWISSSGYGLAIVIGSAMQFARFRDASSRKSGGDSRKHNSFLMVAIVQLSPARNNGGSYHGT